MRRPVYAGVTSQLESPRSAQGLLAVPGQRLDEDVLEVLDWALELLEALGVDELEDDEEPSGPAGLPFSHPIVAARPTAIGGQSESLMVKELAGRHGPDHGRNPESGRFPGLLPRARGPRPRPLVGYPDATSVNGVSGAERGLEK